VRKGDGRILLGLAKAEAAAKLPDDTRYIYYIWRTFRVSLVYEFHDILTSWSTSNIILYSPFVMWTKSG
jgi:hypothetical protein